MPNALSQPLPKSTGNSRTPRGPVARDRPSPRFIRSTAQAKGLTIIFALATDQRDELRLQLLRDAHTVQKRLLRVKSETADASVAADRVMIFDAIRHTQFPSGRGFLGIDAVIKSKLRGWIFRIGNSIVDELDPPRAASPSRAVRTARVARAEQALAADGTLQLAALQHSMAQVAHNLGKYARAALLFRAALATRERDQGAAAKPTLETAYRLANTLSKPVLDGGAEAEELYGRIIRSTEGDAARFNETLRARKMLAKARR